MSRLPGLTLILGATVIASAASYLVYWLVPHRIGVAESASFLLFWSAMYLLVSALAGIQQEVTRGTRGREPVANPRPSPARNFGLVVAGLVFALVVASAPLWVSAVFPAEGWAMVWPLAAAAASYVMVATLAGTLYGITAWFPLALMIAVDALLRLVAVGVAASITSDPVALAWAAAAPFLLTIVVLWPGFRARVAGRTGLDVGYRALSWNVARTMTASASMGILISGLPVVIGIAATDEPPALVATLFLAVTITRAPVIVVVMSLQSYLLVRFRDHREAFWRQFLAIEAVLALGGVVLALIAWLVGPAVFDLLYPGEIRLEGWFYAVLVVSSALIGALVVSASALLSMSKHVVYSVGWLAAALVTVGCFALPLDLVTVTVVALLAGPIAGLSVNAAYLALRTRDLRHAAA